jgi:hypothetical protein
MRSRPIVPRPHPRRRAALACALLFCLGACSAATGAVAGTARPGTTDPRVGLRPGWTDAGEAAHNLALVAHRPKPAGFFNPEVPGDFSYMNADVAFRGDLLFLGGFHGVQVWNIAYPADPTLRATIVCPGGQGDISVHGDLLFMSVEEPRGRVDCGLQGVEGNVSAERFRGVRVFDIRDLDHPRQVAAVQTCRGSHTHTLVADPADRENVYLYVSGTSPVRPAAELAGCSGAEPEKDPNTSYFRIEVIRVPLAAPERAAVVSAPRIFADESGNVAGLWAGGAHGEGTQRTARTDQCHDVTVYPELGLAAGACSGNGILLDIRDVANPRRIEEVIDPNFAYWHSATFNNAGSTVVFTDEWGGGMAARCRAADRPEWGADAIFTLEAGKLTHAGYFKMPAPQTETENCVAHNGSLVPIPGRDVMVQAWYQGGVSVFDFTDPARPQEIAFFDRGPLLATDLVLGGYWSAYWYNGHIYGPEIVRGLDVFELQPSEYLSKNEIEAAKLARVETFNPQMQQKIVWPASVVVARAYLDQLARGGMAADRVAEIARALDAADRLESAERHAALVALAERLEAEVVGAADARRVEALATIVRELSATQHAAR